MYISVKIVGVVLVQDACSGGRPAQGEEAAAQSDDPGRRPASSRRGPARNIRNPCSLWLPAASRQQPRHSLGLVCGTKSGENMVTALWAFRWHSTQ